MCEQMRRVVQSSGERSNSGGCCRAPQGPNTTGPTYFAHSDQKLKEVNFFQKNTLMSQLKSFDFWNFEWCVVASVLLRALGAYFEWRTRLTPSTRICVCFMCAGALQLRQVQQVICAQVGPQQARHIVRARLHL